MTCATSCSLQRQRRTLHQQHAQQGLARRGKQQLTGSRCRVEQQLQGMQGMVVNKSVEEADMDLALMQTWGLRVKRMT